MASIIPFLSSFSKSSYMRKLKMLRAYIDLLRLHFFFVWPLLFCSGLFLSFSQYGGFSWLLIVKVVLIGLFGFEAGFVLNDYVDRDFDKKDVENDKLTKYWRFFGRRPIPTGEITPNKALAVFFILAFIALSLIFSLPYPNSVYVITIMVYSYFVEYFYQVKKRNQRYPIAQLIGRTDFTLFPVAGYLCNGQPDLTALSYFLFFYPFTQAHLGLNDIIDIRNDEARGMKTIPMLYGVEGTKRWILVFTILHLISSTLFILLTGGVTFIGVIFGMLFLIGANIRIMRENNTDAWLGSLPLFHIAMLIYVISILVDYFLLIG